MPARAMEGTILAKLISMAVPLCKRAERSLPRRGPGAPPDYADWKLAALIMTAVGGWHCQMVDIGCHWSARCQC